MEPHVLRPVQAELARANCQGFTDSSSSIVEKEQEGSVAPPLRGLEVDGGDDGASCFGLEISGSTKRLPFI
jgi:hypothetical protein